jgi:Histidine kinase
VRRRAARLDRPKPVAGRPNPDRERPKPRPRAASAASTPSTESVDDDGARMATAMATASDEALDDRWARALCIPAFGLVIPQVTGLFGPLGSGDAAWWLGQLWFIGLSALIWHGNRWFLFAQRRHLNWFDHPLLKVAMLLVAITFYTAPLTVLWLTAWYGWADIGPIDWEAIELAALLNTVAVVFVTHVYETAFLIKARANDLVRVARLERAHAEAQLAALRNQVDPHFLFNCLNTLSHLIDIDPERARDFNERLARVYRYVLRHRDRTLVPLREELEFLDSYAFLLRLRFGPAVEFVVSPEVPPPGKVIPISLQVLVENAVQHNAFEMSAPLRIEVRIERDYVEVSNQRRPKHTRRSGSGLGLVNLDERCRLALDRGIDIEQDSTRFCVRVPVVGEAS